MKNKNNLNLILALLILLVVACACPKNDGDGNRPGTPDQNSAAPNVGGDNRSDEGKTALNYAVQGSDFYKKKDYPNAVKLYRQSLDAEERHPMLGKTMWRVVVDNMGMAYGISGDLDKAKKTFAYGLSKDPDYAMFHYNMACSYAEMNDEDQAIGYLKSAFRNRENMIEGEKMPNPATDSSFSRFMKDEKFLKALDKIKKQ